MLSLCSESTSMKMADKNKFQIESRSCEFDYHSKPKPGSPVPFAPRGLKTKIIIFMILSYFALIYTRLPCIQILLARQTNSNKLSFRRSFHLTQLPSIKRSIAKRRPGSLPTLDIFVASIG